MVAAPRRATLTLVGRSRRRYQVNVYFSDVADAYATLNPNGQAGTGSPTYLIVPEDCQLKDISIASGLTDTTLTIVEKNGAVMPGTILQYADYLNSIQTRPAIGAFFPKGSQLALRQA